MGVQRHYCFIRSCPVLLLWLLLFWDRIQGLNLKGLSTKALLLRESERFLPAGWFLLLFVGLPASLKKKKMLKRKVLRCIAFYDVQQLNSFAPSSHYHQFAVETHTTPLTRGRLVTLGSDILATGSRDTLTD